MLLRNRVTPVRFERVCRVILEATRAVGFGGVELLTARESGPIIRPDSLLRALRVDRSDWPLETDRAIEIHGRYGVGTMRFRMVARYPAGSSPSEFENQCFTSRMIACRAKGVTFSGDIETILYWNVDELLASGHCDSGSRWTTDGLLPTTVKSAPSTACQSVPSKYSTAIVKESCGGERSSMHDGSASKY